MSTPAPLARDRISAITHPPAICPGCYAETGRRVPDGTTTRHCKRHLAEYEHQLVARQVQRQEEVRHV